MWCGGAALLHTMTPGTPVKWVVKLQSGSSGAKMKDIEGLKKHKKINKII